MDWSLLDKRLKQFRKPDEVFSLAQRLFQRKPNLVDKFVELVDKQNGQAQKLYSGKKSPFTDCFPLNSLFAFFRTNFPEKDNKVGHHRPKKSGNQRIAKETRQLFGLFRSCQGRQRCHR